MTGLFFFFRNVPPQSTVPLLYCKKKQLLCVPFHEICRFFEVFPDAKIDVVFFHVTTTIIQVVASVLQ
jgi:hypothetical protein